MLAAMEKRRTARGAEGNHHRRRIAVRRAGDRTFPLVKRYVDEIYIVEEEEITSAILLLLEREKTLAEGAGAAALAALL